jgi:hypothetical protein
MVAQWCTLILAFCGGKRIMSLRPALAKLVRPCLRHKIKRKGLGA